jgi:hypothetical protein
MRALSDTSTSMCSTASWPRIQLGEIEKIRGKAGEPLHLRAHLVDEFPAHRRVDVLVGHELEEASEREKRASAAHARRSL